MSATTEELRELEDAGAPAILLAPFHERELWPPHGKASESNPPWKVEGERWLMDYVEFIRRTKRAVKVPVIASMHGYHRAAMEAIARLIQAAGADAIELSYDFTPMGPEESGVCVENRLLETVRATVQGIDIGVGVKLAPCFSALPYLAVQMHGQGAQALILFGSHVGAGKRVLDQMFWHSAPDLDLCLRWLEILSTTTAIPLAVSHGVRCLDDVIRCLMNGARVVQTSVPLEVDQATHLRELIGDVIEYSSRSGLRSVEELHSVPILHPEGHSLDPWGAAASAKVANDLHFTMGVIQ